MPRYTRFGTTAGYQPQLRDTGARVELFDPERGLHAGDPPQSLLPGFTPESRNWVVDAGYITPRSGLSQFGDASLSAPVLGGGEFFDVTAKAHAAVFSTNTVSFFEKDAKAWSALSYVPAATPDAPSGISRDYWQTASIYDAAEDQNMVVATNDRQTPKFFHLKTGQATFSDFTFPLSHFSTAKVVAAFDNRLIWANVVGANGTPDYPQRLLWSARGNPERYTVGVDGSGFEDLLDARGEIVKLVPDNDSLVIFTTEEIWFGRKRGDAYIFDFSASLRQMGGPYPNTITKVPGGLIFLARNLEIYMIAGGSVQPLGPIKPGYPSRIQKLLNTTLNDADRAFAFYNTIKQRYELYYPDATSSSGFPNRALFFHFDNGAWLEQRFGHDISYGFEFSDPGVGVTWDSLAVTWDSYNVTWDSAGGGGTGRQPVLATSEGTLARMLSTATNDLGTAIDARWRSGGLGAGDQLRYDQLYEVWMEYAAPSSSSLSVFVSEDLGFTWNGGFELSVQSSNISTLMAPVFVTARAPQFELRLNDGSKPKLARMQARLRDGGSWAGA